MIRIGLISDTHGLVRPEALAMLAGSDFIVHAGDICDPAVLDALGRIAPVTAVRGNNDHGPWAQALPDVGTLRAGPVAIRVVHDIADLARLNVCEGADVVVTGHSHRARVERRDGILYVNPGSAGPRRFNLPVSVGWLEVKDGHVAATLHEIDLPV